MGVPLVDPVTGEGRIAAGELPGGPAVTTWHLGAHDKLGGAYARIAAYLYRLNTIDTLHVPFSVSLPLAELSLSAA